MIEQLRLQEGRLFQNEKTLALYLDVKAVVYEAIISASRSEDREAAFTALVAFDEDDEKIISAFLQLAPSGMREYHAKSLHDCVKIVANLLWPTEILLVARPKVSSLLSGVLRRLASQRIVSNGQFLDLDPIKQDFLIREAFRRCLINDCLVVFEQEAESRGHNDASAANGSNEGPTDGAADGPTDGPSDGTMDDLANDEIGPDDSASHMGSVQDERPSGARSTLNAERSTLPVLDETKELEASSAVGSRLGSKVGHKAGSVVGQKAGSVVAGSVVGLKAGSVVAGSVVGHKAGSVIGSPTKASSVVDSRSAVGSVAPRVITVNGDSNSTASKVSGTTATSIMRRALNVRKVHIEPDA